MPSPLTLILLPAIALIEIDLEDSQSAVTGTPSRESHCALLTYVHNEHFMLPIFLRYYLRHFKASDVYILDHVSSDNSTDNLGDANVIKLNYRAYFPHVYLAQKMSNYTAALLRNGYECVLLSEIDDMMAPNPAIYPHGLKQYLRAFQRDPARETTRVSGYHMVHVHPHEPDLDWSAPLLAQRGWWRHDPMYDKPLLTKRPLHWNIGLHWLLDKVQVPIDPDFRLVHLHFIDLAHCVEHLEEDHREKVRLGMVRREEQKRLNDQSVYGTPGYTAKSLCSYANGYFKSSSATTPVVDANGKANATHRTKIGLAVEPIGAAWRTILI